MAKPSAVNSEKSEDVEDGAQKQQREYFLRRQMDAIRKELGETDGSVAEEYRQKIAAAGMPDAVRQQAERELERFERMGEANAESSMIRAYLDWLLAVPWSKRSEDRLDPIHAREVLDADLGVGVVVPWNQEDAVVAANVDGQRDRHARKHHRVVQGNDS